MLDAGNGGGGFLAADVLAALGANIKGLLLVPPKLQVVTARNNSHMRACAAQCHHCRPVPSSSQVMRLCSAATQCR